MTQQTALRVREIAFTFYPVKDMQRARQFYETSLGLVPTEVSEQGNWVEYEVAGAAFSICLFDGLEPTVKGPAIAFEVDDFEGAMQALRAQNVPVLMEPLETPVCWMASVSDPEGNALMIHKRKA